MSQQTVNKREKVADTSGDVLAAQIAKLRALFPEVVAEGKIDFDKLKATLGGATESGPGRFTFSWAGKDDAIALLQTPSRATLIPCPNESVNFDTTGNAFIEGDNLEVLKLLFKPYFGKVKLIYIDPPYNTGQDFIYPDNFADPLKNYLIQTGQIDDEGNLASSKVDRTGRIHSSWLSMMYPRLFLARQLLRDDGVICVSIDDNEVHHLRMLMNEVFGTENFLATFVRRRRMSTGMRDNPLSPDHEYVVTFAKSAPDVVLYGREKEEQHYPYEDSIGKYRSTDLTVGMSRHLRPNQWYALHHPNTKAEYWPSDNRVWRFEPNTMKKEISAGNIIWPGEDGFGDLARPRYKTRYVPESGDFSPVSTWIPNTPDDEDSDITQLVAGMNQHATKEVAALMEGQSFDYPKPVSLLTALIRTATKDADLILDFFSGSATTAQAILELNREDGGNRRFILVQLPEKIDNQQYSTIAEIGKERIRKVIDRLNKGNAETFAFDDKKLSADLGFKVFKLASPNIEQWVPDGDRDPEKYASKLQLFNDPLVAGWTPENVIWEVSLREGFGLNTRFAEKKLANGNTIFEVADPDKDPPQTLAVCFDEEIRADISKHYPLSPSSLFICRDMALDDTAAANLGLQCRLKTI